MGSEIRVAGERLLPSTVDRDLARQIRLAPSLIARLAGVWSSRPLEFCSSRLKPELQQGAFRWSSGFSRSEPVWESSRWASRSERSLDPPYDGRHVSGAIPRTSRETFSKNRAN